RQRGHPCPEVVGGGQGRTDPPEPARPGRRRPGSRDDLRRRAHPEGFRSARPGIRRAVREDAGTRSLLTRLKREPPAHANVCVCLADGFKYFLMTIAIGASLRARVRRTSL